MTFLPDAAEDFQPTGPLWRVSLTYGRPLSEEEGQALFAAFEEVVLSVFLHNKEATDGNHWEVMLTTDGKPDFDALHTIANDIVPLPRDAVRGEELPDEDWLLHVHRHFPPITIGKFFIYGSHYEGEIPKDLIALRIDAATAFGSGEHETTRGCMMALQDLHARGFKPQRLLDMGCGSGILALAAIKLWPHVQALCIDIDPESVVVTHRHAALNGCSANVIAEAGDGYRAPRVDTMAPYDLVLANILAGPLVEMAPDCARVTAAGGYVILSGLLARQESDVTDAHLAQGLQQGDVHALNDWRALVFHKA